MIAEVNIHKEIKTYTSYACFSRLKSVVAVGDLFLSGCSSRESFLYAFLSCEVELSRFTPSN